MPEALTKAQEQAVEALCEWIAIWDAVCDEADPSDDGPLPSWEIARLAMMPWMNPLDFPSAEHFSGYMKADLVYKVRDLVHAFPALSKDKP